MSGQIDQQELRELIERQQVVGLVDRYVSTLDEPSSFDEDWARSLFTEDIRLEHEIAVLEGITEVAAAHRMVMGRWERTLHFSTNHCVELDGDHAHLTARLMAIHVHPGENLADSLIAANVLDADAVRTSSGWRFERFAPRTVWRSGRSPEEIMADARDRASPDRAHELELPPELRQLIESGPMVHLSTINPDGSPQVTVIWVGLGRRRSGEHPHAGQHQTQEHQARPPGGALVRRAAGAGSLAQPVRGHLCPGHGGAQRPHLGPDGPNTRRSTCRPMRRSPPPRVRTPDSSCSTPSPGSVASAPG